MFAIICKLDSVVLGQSARLATEIQKAGLSRTVTYEAAEKHIQATPFGGEPSVGNLPMLPAQAFRALADPSTRANRWGPV